jgi:transposase
MDIVIVGIDLGKNSCSLAGLDALGRVVLRRRMRRGALGSFVTSLRRCVVAMEACRGAHHLGRGFAAQGHEVRLMSPEYVRPYEGTEERRFGRCGDRGGGEPVDDAVR